MGAEYQLFQFPALGAAEVRALDNGGRLVGVPSLDAQSSCELAERAPGACRGRVRRAMGRWTVSRRCGGTAHWGLFPPKSLTTSRSPGLPCADTVHASEALQEKRVLPVRREARDVVTQQQERHA
jgi:hypothetical protein